MRLAATNQADLAFGAALLLALPQGASAQAPEKRKVNIATASLGLPYLPLIIAHVLAAFLPEVKTANIKVEDTYDNHFVENALKKWQGKM